MNKLILKCIVTGLMISGLITEAAAEKNKDQLLTDESPELVGEAIAIELDDRDIGFDNQISKMEMILNNAYGQ